MQAYDDPSPEKDGYLLDAITHNYSQSMCFKVQQRVSYDRDINFDDLVKTPICSGAFKRYAEVDLHELERIQGKISNQGRLDNIDM